MVEKWIIRSFYAKDFYGLNWGPQTLWGHLLAVHSYKLLMRVRRKNRFFS